MITTINVFTVEPPNQQRLVDLLIRATDDFVCKAPGFLSSTLHRGLDGETVTMYAQWRSVEDYEAMRRDPRPAAVIPGGAYDRDIRTGHVRDGTHIRPGPVILKPQAPGGDYSHSIVPGGFEVTS